MTRTLTCIQCPQGCRLTVEADQGYVVSVSGNRCPKGETYARQELENPVRTLTTTVRASGLQVNWVPVRTSRPIPKARLGEAMAAIRSLRIDRPVRAGEAIISRFLGLDADLLATRTVAVKAAVRT